MGWEMQKSQPRLLFSMLLLVSVSHREGVKGLDGNYTEIFTPTAQFDICEKYVGQFLAHVKAEPSSKRYFAGADGDIVIRVEISHQNPQSGRATTELFVCRADRAGKVSFHSA
jgi:hypothetical protein